jgi:hypothetical protein
MNRISNASSRSNIVECRVRLDSETLSSRFNGPHSRAADSLDWMARAWHERHIRDRLQSERRLLQMIQDR